MVWLELVTGKLCTVRGGLYLLDCPPSLLLSPLDPGPLSLRRRRGAVIIFLAMIMRIHMTRLSGKGGLELPLVPVGSLEEFGNLPHLGHHENPVPTLTVTVAEVKLGNPEVGEAHTAVSGPDNDAQHKAAVGVGWTGREFVFAASP